MKTDLVISYDYFESGCYWVVRCRNHGFYRRGVAPTRDRARCDVRKALKRLRLVQSERDGKRRGNFKTTSDEVPKSIEWIKKADTERGFRSEIARSSTSTPR